jgi:hypothetical protein
MWRPVFSFEYFNLQRVRFSSITVYQYLATKCDDMADGAKDLDIGIPSDSI